MRLGRPPLTISVAKNRRKPCGVNLVPANAGALAAISSRLRASTLRTVRGAMTLRTVPA
jgi:hypothetical protein